LQSRGKHFGTQPAPPTWADGSICPSGFVLVSLVVFVRGRLLDTDLYSAALVRTDAYERVYTEVLADPEFAQLQEQLPGALASVKRAPRRSGRWPPARCD
jgi:hypothetical protein